MKRKDALDGLVQLLGQAFPILHVGADSSLSRRVGVRMSGLPIAQFQCTAIGSRSITGIGLNMRVVGVASEHVPMFRDPPGQPPDLLDVTPIVCDGPSRYRWAVDQASYLAAVSDAAADRWHALRADLSKVVSEDLARWVENCELLLAKTHPWRLLAQYGNAPLEGFAFPPRTTQSTFAMFPIITLSALLGLAPVIGSILAIDSALASRLLDLRAQLDATPRA
jgi:hypothetical protein